MVHNIMSFTSSANLTSRGGLMLNRACAVAFFFVLCYFLVVAPAPAVSQVDRGAIVGTVTDPTGARVSGAQVTITSLSTDQSINVTTEEDGNYTAKVLKIGAEASDGYL